MVMEGLTPQLAGLKMKFCFYLAITAAVFFSFDSLHVEHLMPKEKSLYLKVVSLTVFF